AGAEHLAQREAAGAIPLCAGALVERRRLRRVGLGAPHEARRQVAAAPTVELAGAAEERLGARGIARQDVALEVEIGERHAAGAGAAVAAEAEVLNRGLGVASLSAQEELAADGAGLGLTGGASAIEEGRRLAVV